MVLATSKFWNEIGRPRALLGTYAAGGMYHVSRTLGWTPTVVADVALSQLQGKLCFRARFCAFCGTVCVCSLVDGRSMGGQWAVDGRLMGSQWAGQCAVDRRCACIFIVAAGLVLSELWFHSASILLVSMPDSGSKGLVQS